MGWWAFFTRSGFGVGRLLFKDALPRGGLGYGQAEGRAFRPLGGGSGFGVRIAIAHPLLKVLKVLKVLGPKTAIVKGKLAGSTGTVVQN